MQRFQAVAAAGVVLEIASGDVLAHVSLPDFDPNDVRDADDEGMLDLGTQGVFEMGSTFKTFTVAAALDAGRASVNSNFDATEPIKIDRYTINDYHPEERWLRLSEVFRAFVEHRDGAGRRGIGQGAALGLPGTLGAPERH